LLPSVDGEVKLRYVQNDDYYLNNAIPTDDNACTHTKSIMTNSIVGDDRPSPDSHNNDTEKWNVTFNHSHKRSNYTNTSKEDDNIEFMKRAICQKYK
jgi:hypothetical protein